MRSLFWIVAIALCGAPVAAQSDDDELRRIADMAQRCRQESNKFREAGGRPGGSGDPALKWSADFWQYAQEHPQSPAGIQATTHALSWLLYADRDNEVIAKARTLALDFPAWDRLLEGLRHASMKTGDYTTFFDITRRLLQRSRESTLRAAVQIAMGRVYQEQGQPDKAVAVVRSALREAPLSPQADEAEMLLHELRNLRVGGPAPAFEAQSIDGQRISSDEFRGKVVLLNFWASW